MFAQPEKNSEKLQNYNVPWIQKIAMVAELPGKSKERLVLKGNGMGTFSF